MNNHKYIRVENDKWCVCFPGSIKNPRRLGRYPTLEEAIIERDKYLDTVEKREYVGLDIPDIMENEPKRVLILSDPHCGHEVGLTHIDFDSCPMTNLKKRDMYTLRREYYTTYVSMLKALMPFDVVIVNGDLIDGRGERSGSTELITLDRSEQVDMAIAVLEETKAERFFISYGTPYHTGALEDWEDLIAKDVNADIKGHGWIDVNGLIIDYRHFIGSSSVPYGRHTQLAKERLWNVLQSEHGEFPKSDLLIRSHVHYYSSCGGSNWHGVSTPALQGYGTKYGTRKCTGTIDWGFLTVDVTSKDQYAVNKHIVRPLTKKVEPIKI